MKNILKKLITLGAAIMMLVPTFAQTASAFTLVPIQIEAAQEVQISNVGVQYLSTSTKIMYKLDQPAYVTVGIAMASGSTGTEVSYVYESKYQAGGYQTAVWDNRLADGSLKDPNEQYYYWVYAQNTLNPDLLTQYGPEYFHFPEDITTTTVPNNEDIISYIDADPEEFDPWDDEETELRFTLSEDARVDVKIYDKSWDYIRSLELKEDLNKGTHDYDWDGLDNSDDIVDEGKYYMKVIAKSDATGETESRYVKVEVEEGTSTATVAPRLRDVFVSKSSFDANANEETFFVFEMTADADIEAGVYDGGTKIRELYYRKDSEAGVYTVQWDGENDNGTLVKENKTYKIKLHVENDEGDDDASISVKVEDDSEYSKYPNVYEDSTSPVVYSPEEDSYMEVNFRLEKDAYTSVVVYDDDDIIAEIFGGNADEGKNSFKWYGFDDDDDLVSDGVYEYKITAENSTGESEEWGKFMIADSYQYSYKRKCAGFTDVDEDDDTCTAIEWAEGEGIFEGYTDGTFRPEKIINRVEALKVILEAFDMHIYKADGTTLGFSDVDKSAWYMKYVKSGQKFGIVKGYIDGTFRPNKDVTKAEAVVMTVNAAEMMKDLIVPSCNDKPYFDVPLFGWETDAVCIVKDFDLTDDKNTFDPKKDFSRGEMAELLYNFYKAELL